MKKYIQEKYKKHGKKFIIGFILYLVIKWGLILTVGKYFWDAAKN